MKTKTKVLGLVMAAVMLVTTSIFGTMAYLTSTPDAVVNTFTVGNVRITLDEAPVNLDGNVTSTDPKDRLSGVNDDGYTNQYKLMPGHTYTKDPTVHVTSDSEDCYIRMFVTITNWTTLAAKLPAGYLPEQLCDWNSTYWINANYAVQGNDAVLEFRHNAIVTAADSAAGNIPALFEHITLPGEVKDLTDLDTVKITVTAEAIQADGFTASDTLSAADAAFIALSDARN